LHRNQFGASLDEKAPYRRHYADLPAPLSAARGVCGELGFAIPAAPITDFIVVFTGFTGVVVTFTLYLSVE
jgi:hypothetical protein